MTNEELDQIVSEWNGLPRKERAMRILKLAAGTLDGQEYYRLTEYLRHVGMGIEATDHLQKMLATEPSFSD